MGRATALLLIALAALPAWPTGAQTTGDCGLGEATALLDVANVRARLFNNGGLFWRGGSPLYEVPKGSGVTPIFLTNLWVGGLVEGELRMSGNIYADPEMWPGPLDEEANPPDDCSVYDRLFSVYDEDIRRYNQTGEATADMQDWPWHLGAPVYDGDGNPDNYNLAGGDRPHVFGDQTVWWVMNDAGNLHLNTESSPIGLEVQASAFAATDVGLWSPHTTFYRYELVNRLSVPIDSVYMSMYAEGYPDGFFVGSDSVAGISYLYKAYDYDPHGYGDRPPAIGFTFVQGPLVNDDGEDNDRDGTIDEDDERLRMTSFLVHNHNFGINGWPHTAIGWYRFLKGLWNDGSPMTVGGCEGVWFSREPTRFMFSGRPPGFWSEENSDGMGSRCYPWFNVLFTSTGPFRIEPGETQEIVFAIVYSQGNDRLDQERIRRDLPSRRPVPAIQTDDDRRD